MKKTLVSYMLLYLVLNEKFIIVTILFILKIIQNLSLRNIQVNPHHLHTMTVAIKANPNHLNPKLIQFLPPQFCWFNCHSNQLYIKIIPSNLKKSKTILLSRKVPIIPIRGLQYSKIGSRSNNENTSRERQLSSNMIMVISSQ